MPGYLLIEGDPTKWWLAQPVQPTQLTGRTPLSVQVEAPLAGTLLVSPNSASVAVFSAGAAPASLDIPNPVIYVPTAAGPSAGSAGHELSGSADLATLADQITTLMSSGGFQSVALSASGAALVLNGATLSFVVLCPATPASSTGGSTTGGSTTPGSIPHDGPA